MKLLLALVLLATPAFAEEGADKFAERKQEMLGNIDQRLAELGKLKSCVQGAADHAAVKACHEAHHSSMGEVKKGNMDERMKHMEERMSKMKEKRAKIGTEK